MTDQTAAPDLQIAWREGARALREGRPGEAVSRFSSIVEAGQATGPVHIGLALAHKALGDAAAEKAALDAALKLDPRDIRALIMTGDHYDAAGDGRAAASFYDAAVKIAVLQGAVEPALQAEVGRAQHMRERYAQSYEAHLRDALVRKGLDAPGGRRMRRALDLMLGKTELHLQQPKTFYYPELANIQYAERSQFPWMDKVEAATHAIRAELVKLLEEDGAFAPYVELEADRPFFDDHGMLGNPSWSAFYLWKGGAPVPENAARCPATMAAMEEVPLCRIPGRTPAVLFSLLKPGAHIPPHHGFTNARFICHLPLIVPEGCAMRVGDDTRAWEEGKACLFDDSIEHEAWNRNPERLRVVLIFDVWRPELSAEERELIVGVLQAVDEFRGAAAPAWD